MITFFKKLFLFYYEGLKNLTPFWKKLWKLLWLKAFIIAIFAYLIFPDILHEYFDNDEQRAKHVSNEILNSNP